MDMSVLSFLKSSCIHVPHAKRLHLGLISFVRHNSKDHTVRNNIHIL